MEYYKGFLINGSTPVKFATLVFFEKFNGVKVQGSGVNNSEIRKLAERSKVKGESKIALQWNTMKGFCVNGSKVKDHRS